MAKALAAFDLSAVKAIGLDETASKRGQSYVTVFIDMERREKPVLFVTPGHSKATLKAFRSFLQEHKGHPEHILEVVFDMSGAFLSAVPKQLPNAQITVDWFHIVQTFTRALDEVRKAENRIKPLPKHLRWAVLKRGEADRLTTNQLKAMAELLAHHPVHQLCLGADRCEPTAQAHASSATDPADACQKSRSTLDLDLHECPPRGAERAVPGGARQSPRISQRGDLHDHDLHDRQPAGAVLKST